MSPDPEQEFFADGMTEDIITGLSRLRWLFAIARNSTFTYKGKAVDVRQISRELGVRYVLEGSVRASGKRIRITGQLIDAETGKHIWAEKYDRQLDDIFAVQDEITQNVVATIEPHLYAEEGFRSSQQPPENVATWGLVVRAITLIHRVERKANEEAQVLLDLAIRKEPSYARAYAILAWAKWWQGFSQWAPDWPSIHAFYKEAEELAERALALDPDEPWARMTFGLIISGSGHHDRALEQFHTALDAHPNWALGRTMYGVALLRAGYFDHAIDRKSTRLNSSHANISYAVFCLKKNTLIVITAFAAAQFGSLITRSTVYLLLNLAGVLVLAVLAAADRHFAFLLLAAVWAAVSAW